MNTHYNEEGRMVLEVNDNLEIALSFEIKYEYRSHINGMQAINPNNWVAVDGKGSDGKDYTAWYFIKDINNTDPEDINYDEPDDIEDEYGYIIYESDNE